MSDAPDSPHVVTDPKSFTPRELDQSIKYLENILTQRINELQRWMEDYIKHHEYVHEADKEQKAKDAEILKDKFMSINEVREQLGTQKAEFVTREYMDSQFHSLDSRLDALEKNTRDYADAKFDANALRLATLERAQTATAAERAGTGTTLRWIIAAAGFIATVLGIVLTILVLTAK